MLKITYFNRAYPYLAAFADNPHCSYITRYAFFVKHYQLHSQVTEKTCLKEILSVLEIYVITKSCLYYYIPNKTNDVNQ